MGALWACWFDGVCEPVNPGGHAAFGILIKRNGHTVVARGGYVGHDRYMSNNVAEYAGMLAVLEELLARDAHGVVEIRGDSKLVINQLANKWKVHGGHYVPYHERAVVALRTLHQQVAGNLSLIWVPRAENGDCDHYSKQELRDRGVQFRIQPEAT